VADRPVGTITVSNRTIDLAGEIIAISQIVRLRELNFDVRRGFSAGSVIALVAGVLAVFYGSSFVAGSSSSGSGRFLLPLLGVAVAIGALIYALHTRTRYILAIELASGSLSGLSANDRNALHNLKQTIRDVIEHPPLQPTAINVGEVYAVDARGSQGSQFGSGNVQTNRW
jgi:Family of unknown function (DUF6232)